MSITLFCLVKGNTTANAFAVDIDSGKAVSHLKEAIKAKKHKTFHGVEADELRLWKVEIGGDHLDDPLKNLTLNDNNELSAIKKISKYFPDTPVEEHIHVLVDPPPSTAISSREQELLDRIALLEKSLSKSTHIFDVVVKPKRVKTFKWTVNIEHATLEGLKNFIRGTCPTPALENDGAVLNILNDEGKTFVNCSRCSCQKRILSLP
ncbi:hypothetical protein C1646_446868 [Rhizophagus diaphanus]|nr:hypothetical protein C1646_446868 [Rhizophagus diaphanus] [Rhizophagus sp. MUCL 43196]